MIDWEQILNLAVAAIVGIVVCVAYGFFSKPSLEEMALFLILWAVTLLYAIFLQLGDIKRRMK